MSDWCGDDIVLTDDNQSVKGLSNVFKILPTSLTGPCKVCRHSLNGPVNFLLSPELPTTSLLYYDNNTGPPLPKRDDLADEDKEPLPVEENNNITKYVILAPSRRVAKHSSHLHGHASCFMTSKIVVVSNIYPPTILTLNVPFLPLLF